MKYTVTLGPHAFDVTVTPDGVAVAGRQVAARLRAVPGTPLRQLVLPDRTETFAMVRLPGGWRVVRAGEVWDMAVEDERTRQLRAMTGDSSARRDQVVRAPMPGLVLRLEVDVGSAVGQGAGLLVLEAMKMENELTSPIAGVVRAVHVKAGQAVEKGVPLLEVAADS